MLVTPILCACLAAFAPAGDAVAQPDRHQDSESRAPRRQAPPPLSVREIERRVVPRVPGAQYLGFDYDPATEVYTLKFLRNGSVIWVDVDGRTGAIVRKSGS
ncbi:hypothetical protein P6144_06130 [Sphingomonas sp. HITSZ_GF]|uniref:hypothetical protein n=1 Tax=Sphingomonas sp. HITSZ_GF TaxID=3037247 RepID=UPI00240E97AE|nr:hypothetical protein [Sphingomonas sp. HITSZ_GF]MDG2533216.1 hypothetical protein [Sphingomonas sp. HITSZ_GF]